jgi:hypothetical protein
VNHLIAAVISDQEFIKNKIKEYHICMLQLAVEIFKTTTDENLVKSLVEEHNLRFIDYMDGTHEIIDTKDMLNYKQNGVMIFHNSRLNSVLIRHEKKHISHRILSISITVQLSTKQTEEMSKLVHS